MNISWSDVTLLQSLMNLSDPVLDTTPEVSTFAFVTEGALISLIGCLGVVANLVTLVVLSRPQMRCSIHCFLQALAAFDCGVLASALLTYGLSRLGSRMACLATYATDAAPFVIPIAYPVGLIAQTGSVWTTVAVTVERYIAVCHPLRAKSVCTQSRARALNTGIVIFSLLYNAPRFWEVERALAFSPELNRTVYRVVASPLRLHKLYYEVYHVWLYLLAMYFIPFSVLVTLNCAIWRAVRRADRERQSRRQRRELSLAVMLLCVVVVFLLCNLPALVVNVIEYFDVFVQPLVRVSNLLVTVNSSVNFVIYCIFGGKFKRTFLVLFCRYNARRGVVNDSFQGLRFRTVKSSSVSANHSLNGNCHI